MEIKKIKDKIAILSDIYGNMTALEAVIADLPGMGLSNAPLGFASSDKILEALLKFSDEIISGPFVVIGYSYEGYLARAMTAIQAERIEGLCLLAPMVVPDHKERNLPDATWFKVYRLEAEKEYQKVLGPGPDRDFIAKLDENYALTFDLDQWAQGKRFSGPSLIVLGRQDDVVGFNDQIRLLEDYPRASLAVLDWASHNLQFEQRELLTPLIENWLTRIDNQLQL